MATTVIDALVVTLGLDPKGFNRGRAEMGDGLKKTRDQAATTGKDLEIFAKRTGDFFGRMRNETVGFLLAFQGISSVSGFIQNLLTGDAATGRLAKNIGMATNELSAWQIAVKSVGGDSREADAALSSIAEAFQSFRLTGTTGHDADFKGLGVTLKDLENPADALMKMAEAGERMDKTEFYARLMRIGIPPSVINLLEKGRGGLTRLIDEKKKDGAASDADAEAAARFEAALVDLESTVTALVRPALYQLVLDFVDFLDKVKDGTIVLPDLNDALLIVLGTALLLEAPFVAAGAAIALIALNLDKVKAAWEGVKDFWGTVTNTDPNEDGGPGARSSSMQWDEQSKTWTDNEGRKFNGDMKQISGPPPRKPGDPPAGGGGGVDRGSVSGIDVPDDWRVGGRHATGSRPDPAAVLSSLTAKGVPGHIARGVTAGVVAEGGSLGMAANGAFGIGQWRGARQKELFRRYGRNPSLEQQIEFLVWELRGGDHGGASVMASANADDALSNYIGGDDWGFMRPGAGREGDMQRGRRWLGGGGGGSAARVPRARLGGAGGVGGQSTTVGTINVYTAATDAPGIARELPGQIQRRGLTTQANRGQQ